MTELGGGKNTQTTGYSDNHRLAARPQQNGAPPAASLFFGFFSLFFSPGDPKEGTLLRRNRCHACDRCLRGGGTPTPRKAWVARAGGDIPVHQSAAGRDHAR